MLMRKNIEPRKYVSGKRRGEVINGFHQIGEVCVDSGQIGITDPCRREENPDLIVDTNFGDGMFPIYEHWENNERLALCIPLSTELHNELQDHLKNLPISKPSDPSSYKKDNLKPGEFNPKDLGIDGYKYVEDMNEDYKKQ
jgi:hypothetical protein